MSCYVPSMREVPAKLFGFMREMSRRSGADVDGAQEGLALRRANVDAPGERVDWDEVALFLERAHGHQTDEEIETVGETYVQTHLWQQLVARVLGTPRLVYEVCYGPLCRLSFPHMDIAAESHATGVRIEVRLPESYVASRVFFRGTLGEVRFLTTLLGLPPAYVEADIGPRHAVYDVRLDEPPMALDRAVGVARRASDRLAEEAIGLMRRAVSAGMDEDEGEVTVLELQRRLGLTHTEARVTARLAAGRSVKEIADALGIRVSTVRSHLKSAFAKSGTRGQTDLIRLVLTGARRD